MARRTSALTTPRSSRAARPRSRLALEQEDLVSTAQAFWRSELAQERTRSKAALDRKDAQILDLRKKLDQYEERATRREEGAPERWSVRQAWRAAQARGGSAKEADLEVATAFKCSTRTVQRLMARTDVLLAESMGVTVARLREFQGR